MSVETIRKDSFQIIRFVSDMVMESDSNAVKQVVEQAILNGTKNFVFSVSIGSLTNQRLIFNILLWCKDIIMQNKGQMLFIEKDDGSECVFRSLCESLQIPIYQNMETSVVTFARTAL